MSSAKLPDRASLEYLKRLAKERLRDLRRTEPETKLAVAQLAIAREHGFSSWRALKVEVDRRQAPAVATLVTACNAGDVEAVRALLDRDPGLARERAAGGTTGLHAAVGHPEVVRLLLERGADPNARDEGDNALPLHFASGGGHLDSIRALLDAGSDVDGVGDLHRLEAIGWATVFGPTRRDVVELLVDRGARHHVFSAIALGDRDLLRRVVEADPEALARRLSRFEGEQTALHYVIAPPDGLLGGVFRTGDHYRTLDLLIELGADVEAVDGKGRSPLAIAMLRGDLEAMRRLHAAGAKEPEPSPAPTEPTTGLGKSIGKLRPMVSVSNIAATIAWYRAVGFELLASHDGGAGIDWASVSFGAAEIMLVPSPNPATGISIWIDTDRLDELYRILKRRQLDRSREVLAGRSPEGPEIRFSVDLHTAFYGQREFGLEDPDGVNLYFAQQIE